MKKNPLIVALVIFQSILFAQVQKIALHGTYQGKNVYVQNPLLKNGIDHCISQILMNGSLPDENFKVGTFSLSLEGRGFKIGDTLKIIFFHHKECDQTSIRIDSGIKSTAHILSMTADNEGTIRWKTKNELNKLAFVIELFRWNKWVKVGEVEGNGKPTETEYQFRTIPCYGENKVRVLQVNEFYLSQNVKFTSDVTKVNFEFKKKDKIVEFTSETMYEVYNDQKLVVKKGWAKTIDCKNLPKGKYTLNYDNSTGEFKI